MMTHDLEKKDDGLLIRARALCGAGRLAWYELDLAAARAHLEEGMAIFRRAGDPAGTLDAMSSVIMVLSWQGEDAAALALVQEGMSLLRQIEDRQKQLPILSNFGWAVAFTCSPETLDDSWNINQEVATLARAAGDKRSLAWALNGLGLCCYWRDDFAAAQSFLEESDALFRELGELWAAAQTAYGLGNMATRQGRYQEARALQEDSMALQTQIKNWVGVPYTLDTFGYLAIAEKQPQRAARLLAAAEKLRETDQSSRLPLALAHHEREMATLCSMLDAAELQAAWAQGRAMTRDEAIEYALKNDDA